jgi:hypothetical protein
LEGKSQAFVGSACTLEILDENGRLIRRMPQFWGKVSHFAFCDGPQGSINLLASRIYNGTNDVAIINNRTLDPNPRGFASVPPGCTFVPGWSSMNRRHVFYEDFDGDGVKEVMSETNGTWNRVTIWRVDGRALYDASFGPGERIPAVTMRDVDVCDLDGNGTKEILAATSRRLVVALDHQCRKVWATRLKSPATAMKCVRLRREENPWVIVACEDGSILGIDSRGKPIRSDAVKGRATCIELIASSRSSPLLLVATDQGQVKGFGADP